MAGWFRKDGNAGDAETYGRHTVYRPSAVPVVVLLQVAVNEGRALRLRWEAKDGGNGWPAGVMAVVR